MMNPFRLYELLPTLFPDPKAVRHKYHALQRLWHPDFHGDSAEALHTAQIKSAENNEAFKILNSTDLIAHWLLQHHGYAEQLESNRLSQDFLMEMMEIQDLIVEANSGNISSEQQAAATLTQLMAQTEIALRNLDPHFQNQAEPESSIWSQLLQVYQQRRYLSRLLKNLQGVNEM